MSRALQSLPGLVASIVSRLAWAGVAGGRAPRAGRGRRPAGAGLRFVVVYAVAVVGFLLLVSARDALSAARGGARSPCSRASPSSGRSGALRRLTTATSGTGACSLPRQPHPRRAPTTPAGRGRLRGPRPREPPDLRTPYPPLAQALFLGLAGLGGGLTALKLVLGAADLLVAAAVWWLADAQRRRRALLLYLACPFVVVETWWSAHLDVVAALFVVLAAGLLARRRDTPAGVALAAAALVKVTPLALAVPALLGRRARPVPFSSGSCPRWCSPALPYALTGGVLGSLTEAGTRWKAGSAVFDVVDAVAGPAGGEGDVRRPRRRRPPRPLAPLPRPGADRRRLRLVVDPRGAPAAEHPPVVLDRPRGARPRRRRLDAGAARPRGAAPLRTLAADAARRPARHDRHLPARAGGRPRAGRGMATTSDWTRAGRAGPAPEDRTRSCP